MRQNAHLNLLGACTMDKIKFQHLPHKDGGFDSVCLRCLATVAVKQYGAQLTREESKHICEDREVEKLKDWLQDLRFD